MEHKKVLRFAVNNNFGPNEPIKIDLVTGNMINHAIRLSSKNRVALLNMANGYTAGGGFLDGCRAQEEQLCCRSNLFIRLKLAFSKYNLEGTNILQKKAMITPNVKFEFGKSSINIISAAAKRYSSEKEALSCPTFIKECENLWFSILDTASNSLIPNGRLIKNDILVLGAIGCGAFHNPPDIVSKCLINVLDKYKNEIGIKKIVIVVMNDHNSQDNVKRFVEPFLNIKNKNFLINKEKYICTPQQKKNLMSNREFLLHKQKIIQYRHKYISGLVEEIILSNNVATKLKNKEITNQEQLWYYIKQTKELWINWLLSNNKNLSPPKDMMLWDFKNGSSMFC